MNNEMIRALLAMTAFGAVLLGLACGTANQNTANSSVAGTPATPPPACSKGNVEAAINAAINGNNGLQSQHAAKRFNIAVDEYPSAGHLRVALNGKVMGEGAYSVLMNSFNQYVRRGCVETVKFDAVVTTALADPFEWTSFCESPCIPSDGACVCPSPGPMSGNVTNTNTAPNTNSKSNSNGNANANSNPKSTSNTNSNPRQSP